MNIRRLLFDVDKALSRPSLLDIAKACPGVQAFNISVGDIDVETVDMNVTIEGESLDYDGIVVAIETTSAVVHGVEQIAVGNRIIERVERARTRSDYSKAYRSRRRRYMAISDPRRHRNDGNHHIRVLCGALRRTTSRTASCGTGA
jgi:uncharacterized protein